MPTVAKKIICVGSFGEHGVWCSHQLYITLANTILALDLSVKAQPSQPLPGTTKQHIERWKYAKDPSKFLVLFIKSCTAFKSKISRTAA